MSQDRGCCALIQGSGARARDRRYNDPKPQPWLALKMMVAVTLGIMGYTAYVYTAVFVVPMLQERQGALSGRNTAIALLVPFSLLFMWMVWAYAKVVLTSPGYARDHVEKTTKPLLPLQSTLAALYPPINGDLDIHIGRPSYEDILKATGPPTTEESPPASPSNSNAGAWMSTMKRPTAMGRTASTMTIKSGSSHAQLRFDAGEMVNPTVHEAVDELPEIDPMRLEPIPRFSRPSTSTSDASTIPDIQTSVLDAPAFDPNRRKRRTGKLQKGHTNSANWLFCCCVPCVDNHEDHANELESGHYDKATPRKIRRKREKNTKPRMYIARRPPMTPFLLPAYRYCERDELVKPHRTHHCRNCGTCVLKYDHHCPWIGQCVGAHNQKFFLNFCQAAFFFTTYVFGTLLPYTVKGLGGRGFDTSPQQLVIIALAAIFALFTFSLATTHIYMILRGQTTVESMKIRTMKQRESEQLMKAYGWWQLKEKRLTLNAWDREWGKLDTEGHLWWIGGKKREWEGVMGTMWLGWILPIGQSLDDGLDYPHNLRFDDEGRWRRRHEWPPEFQ